MSRYRPTPPRFTAADLLAQVAAGATPSLPVRMRNSERREVAEAMRRLMAEREICAEPAGLLCGLRCRSNVHAVAAAHGIAATPEVRASARAATLIAAGCVSAEAVAVALEARTAHLAALYDRLRPEVVAMRATGATMAEIATKLGVSRFLVAKLLPQDMRALPGSAKRKRPRKIHAAPKPPVAPKPRAPRCLPAAPPPPPAPAPVDVDVDALMLARMERARAMLGRRMDPSSVAQLARLPLREVYRVAAEVRAQQRAAA